MKACSKCKMEKPKSEFYHAANRKSGLDSWCRGCHKEKSARVNPRKTLECYRDASSKQCPKCREIKAFAEYFKSASQKDGLYGYCKGCQREANRLSNKKNRPKILAKELQRKAADPSYAMRLRILGLVRKSLDRRALAAPVRSVTGSFWDSVGYTSAQLAAHIEKQFLPGMTWDNRREWHVDHILPIRSFTYDSFQCPDFKACWALANLRPIWALDNLKKGCSEIFLL